LICGSQLYVDIRAIETTSIALAQTTRIKTFDFSAGVPECGRAAAFLIKSIYTPEYLRIAISWKIFGHLI
jgi:hypothetical protein